MTSLSHSLSHSYSLTLFLTPLPLFLTPLPLSLSLSVFLSSLSPHSNANSIFVDATQTAAADAFVRQEEVSECISNSNCDLSHLFSSNLKEKNFSCLQSKATKHNSSEDAACVKKS